LQTFKYIEIACGGPQFRGSLIDKKDLNAYIKDAIKEKAPLYRSMYLYGEEALALSKEKGSLKEYNGPRAIDVIILDIDKGQNSDQLTLHKAQSIAHTLVDELELEPAAFRAYFSGTGYHIHIPNSAFRFVPGETLPWQVKATIRKMFPDVDQMIYMRTGLYRVAHTINQKTGKYKIPLTYKELMESKPEDILVKAMKPRIEFPYSELLADSELEDYVITTVPKIRDVAGKVLEPKKIVTCVQTLYNRGAQEGSRHTTLLRIASHFRRSGVSSKAAKAAMLEWNGNSLNDEEILRQTEYAYNRGYKYGCNDEMLKSACNPRCIHYKRKDYLIDVLTPDVMQQNLRTRLTTDFTGKSYDLARALGHPEYDCIFYPGELITIFGPTGSSKTTLAHNIALGYNHIDNKIDESQQLSTLYLSLELSDWYMHRRSLQIINGVDKATASSNYEDLYEQSADKLAHLSVQTVAPTIEQIRERILELQPAMVIVDYIDLVETPKGCYSEYDQIKFISHSLSSMAVQQDMIIIQVSQVSRDYSRNEVLDLYAGKGSGAIENASRKVIGLNGQANSTKKTINVFKNTDGEIFETEVEWTPSFRLRRI
jgi:hypothetical protein